MKRPTWATIVGVLGIIFGCTGILGSAQEIFMPQMLEMQKEMFTEIQTSTNQDNCNETQTAAAQMPEVFNKMWDLPEWFGPWSVFSGITNALISALYLFASIWLLMTKPSAIKLFYWAAGASIVLTIVQGVVGYQALSFMAIAFMWSGVFGVLIDIVLLIVVATGNKEAFQVETAESP